jgi:biotin synthase-like enzyme
VLEKHDDAKKKAALICNERIFIPKKILLPYPLERSTTGPNTRGHSITLRFNRKNIKLAVTRDTSEPFSLQKDGKRYIIMKKGRVFLSNVQVNPVFFHAPEQAFVNIDERCINNCKFCTSKHEKFEFLRNYNSEKIVNLLINATRTHKLKAVAVTSGIYPNTKKTIEKMVYIIRGVRRELSEIPIGVEPSIEKTRDITILKEAGADEIKINLQIPDKKMFDKVCPDLDYYHIIAMLEKAVEIFGRGKVSSNILYGIGETDEQILEGTKNLAAREVVPTLRKIRINKHIKKELENALNHPLPSVTPKRIIRLALMHKILLKRHNLSTRSFETMCHKCGCCDIVPFWDI